MPKTRNPLPPAALPEDLQWLSTRGARARGAMFRSALGGVVLAFSYPTAAPRLFHTFFSPPLRIIALGDDGRPIVDRVVPPGRFVRLPAVRLVIECDPGRTLALSDLHLIRQAAIPAAERQA